MDSSAERKDLRIVWRRVRTTTLAACKIPSPRHRGGGPCKAGLFTCVSSVLRMREGKAVLPSIVDELTQSLEVLEPRGAAMGILSTRGKFFPSTGTLGNFDVLFSSCLFFSRLSFCPTNFLFSPCSLFSFLSFFLFSFFSLSLFFFPFPLFFPFSLFSLSLFYFLTLFFPFPSPLYFFPLPTSRHDSILIKKRGQLHSVL